MYFVHSFYVQPENDNEIISLSKYGSVDYCSSIVKENVIGMQFHPEKSGSSGLRIYKCLKERKRKTVGMLASAENVWLSGLIGSDMLQKQGGECMLQTKRTRQLFIKQWKKRK